MEEEHRRDNGEQGDEIKDRSKEEVKEARETNCSVSVATV